MIFKWENDGNKIIYTNKIFKSLKTFKDKEEKNAIFITPLSKISDLVNLKTTSHIRREIIEEAAIFINTLSESKELKNIVSHVNNVFDTSIIESIIDDDKILKLLLNVSSNYVNENFLLKFLDIMEKHSTKRMEIILVDMNIAVSNYNMLNVHILTSNIHGIINWNTLEQLVIFDKEDPIEILNKEKFLSWLELKTKTVLTIQDINDYLSMKNTFNAYLIYKALKQM